MAILILSGSICEAELSRLFPTVLIGRTDLTSQLLNLFLVLNFASLELLSELGQLLFRCLTRCLVTVLRFRFIFFRRSRIVRVVLHLKLLAREASEIEHRATTRHRAL